MSEQQTQPPDRTFKLPDNVMAVIQGLPVELLLGVGRTSEDAAVALEETLGIKLPPAELHNNGSLPLGFPEPAFPDQGEKLSREDILRRDFFNQLNMAQQMVSMLMQLRHHQMAATAPDDDTEPGEEWKQRQQEASGPLLQFTEAEDALYNASLGKLTTFITEGPPPPPGDPPVM